MASEAAGAAGFPEGETNQGTGIVYLKPGQRRSGLGDSNYYFHKCHPQVILLGTAAAPITASATYPSAAQPLSVVGQPVDSIAVDGFLYHSVQVTGTFNSASLQFVGSLDGITYSNIGSAITSAGLTVLNSGLPLPLSNLALIVSSAGVSTSLLVTVTSLR